MEADKSESATLKQGHTGSTGVKTTGIPFYGDFEDVHIVVWLCFGLLRFEDPRV